MTPAALSPEGKEIIDTFIRDHAKDPYTFNSIIHEKDEMYLSTLQNFCKGNKDCAYLSYLQCGKQMIDELGQIVEWGFGGFGKMSSFLDFACGYGRFTRFLIQEFPAERIWASDIYEDAVKFQVEQFGVNGRPSALIPADYTDDRRYDCIFVASLFSHLPERAFAGWLKRLYNMLTPDGLLIFSVHDIDIMPRHLNVGAGGITFIPESESLSLDKSYYGTTYVAESFVKNAIANLSSRKIYWQRIPKGLAGYQDLYLISPNLDKNLSNLKFSFGLQGYLDSCAWTDSGDICLRGWAADFGSEASVVENIEILVNGRLAERRLARHARPDVAKHFHDERGYHSGWSCSVKGERIVITDMIVVKIRNDQGKEQILRIGPLDSFPMQS